MVDVGPHAFDPDDDYPTFCLHTGDRVVADPGSLGVVIGGSGNGEQIAANKVAGVRAALAWSVETAQLARQHNDANVVAVGARQHTLDEADRHRRGVPDHALLRQRAARPPDRPGGRVRADPASCPSCPDR